MAARREEPEVVEVARLVPGPVQECDGFLDRYLVQGVDPDLGIFGKVAVLLVAAQYRAVLERQDDAFADRDVGLDGFPSRRRERALSIIKMSLACNSRRQPFVAMMGPADLRQCRDRTSPIASGNAMFRSVFRQRQMRPRVQL